jgi:YfiH family protein
VLRCGPLAAAADHFFTSRDWEVRDPQAVAAAIGVDPGDLLLVKQVHGAAVAVASRDRPRPWRKPEADAILTDDPDAAVAVRVADCVPILVAEDTGRAVGAIHAGWRGMAARAPIAAVAAIRERYGVRPERLIAAIGPSIGPCCYEVDESTRRAFTAAGHAGLNLDSWFEPRAAGKFHLDLWRVARDQLEAAGLLPSRVFGSGLCTKTHAHRFHSYRVDGASAGRMAAVIRPSR